MMRVHLGWLMIMGCSGGTPTDNPETSTGDSSDSGEGSEEAWSIEPLDEIDGGLQLRLVADPEGGAWAAWFANAPTLDGTCDEIDNAPPPRERFDLRLTRVTEMEAGPVQAVASPVAPVQPTGLDLALDASGHPAVAFAGGEPEGQYCGGHDAVVARTDGTEWTTTTAAADSDDAASGEPASDAGFVVGQWPALAFDADGEAAVLYRDVHFGSLQRDDQFRADAELAQQGSGGWNHRGVDQGDGAGLHGRLAFDAQGRPVVAYVIPVEQAQSRLGVWVARLDGETWERVRLFDGEVRDQISLVVADHVAVAFTDVAASSARLRMLSPGAAWADPDAWTNERVGRGPYDEGRHVSVAFESIGKPRARLPCLQAPDRCRHVVQHQRRSARGGDEGRFELVVRCGPRRGWRELRALHEPRVRPWGPGLAGLPMQRTGRRGVRAATPRGHTGVVMRWWVPMMLGGCTSIEPNSLRGSLADLFDLGFDETRARLYEPELSIEYVDSERSGRVAIRVTLQRPDASAPGTFALPGLGYVGLADKVGGQLPPLVDGQVVLDLMDPVAEGAVTGSFRAVFETPDEQRFVALGSFDTQIEVIDESR